MFITWSCPKQRYLHIVMYAKSYIHIYFNHNFFFSWYDIKYFLTRWIFSKDLDFVADEYLTLSLFQIEAPCNYYNIQDFLLVFTFDIPICTLKTNRKLPRQRMFLNLRTNRQVLTWL